MEFGYARVSTTHQDLDRQLDAHGWAGIALEANYQNKKTGATIERPGFAELLRYARPGDTIVATNLDRLGRNLRECLNVIHDLQERGIGIRTSADPVPIDTTESSAMAELAVTLLALFAHMERVFMTEREAHPRAVAAAKGKQPGRPPSSTPTSWSQPGRLSPLISLSSRWRPPSMSAGPPSTATSPSTKLSRPFRDPS